MEQRIPAEVFSPGEYIKDEMEARGWTQEDLANILSRPIATINKILNAKTSITVETAMGLAAAFGTSADVWLNLETAYSLWKANSPPRAIQQGDSDASMPYRPPSML